MYNLIVSVLLIDRCAIYSVGYRCPENYNSADFIMKILSNSNKSVNSICDEFATSKHAEFVKNAISNEIYYVSILLLRKKKKLKIMHKGYHCFTIYAWLNNRINISKLLFSGDIKFISNS